jgi:three-Cys-motif partner protein
MIYAICDTCGEYLDRDDPTCRVCGENNDTGPQDDTPVLDREINLDQLGQWSHVKHDILTSYGAEYAKILAEQKRKRTIKRFIYIDGYAGAGVAIDIATGDYVPGSALLALDITPRFDEYHFIELDDRRAGTLERLTTGVSGVRIHRGDSNTVLAKDVLPRCHYEDYARGLCLLDPYGLSVDYKTLETIGKMKSVEIFFNFMVVGANRNVLWTDPSRVSPKRRDLMTKVWGDESWRQQLYRRTLDLFGDFEEKVSNDEVVEAYRQRLLAAGFKFVPKPVPMRNSTNATIYYLFFASPNATGSRIVEHIFNKYRV